MLYISGSHQIRAHKNTLYESVVRNFASHYVFVKFVKSFCPFIAHD